MNTNQTFTAQDVADFAQLIKPFIGQTLTAGTVLDAAAIAEREDERWFSSRIAQQHILVDMLAGTYDEFRAEAGIA